LDAEIAEISRRAAEERSSLGVNNPFDSAFFEGPLPEIQEETHFEAAKSKLGVDLGEMGLHQLLHRFGLYDHPVVYHQIHPVGSFNQKALPFDIQEDLPQNLVPISVFSSRVANLP